MRALQEAIMTAKHCGIDDFNQMLADHLTDGYVICTPDTFICAMETWRDFGESCASPGWFVTLAVGNIAELCRIDPNPDDHKWIGYVRHEGDDIRWVDYQRLRKKILHLPESQK